MVAGSNKILPTHNPLSFHIMMVRVDAEYAALRPSGVELREGLDR